MHPVTAPTARAFVPMIHVASLPRSIAFYAVFDFSVVEVHQEACLGDNPVWAWMESVGGAQFMQVKADSAVDDTVQGALFYISATTSRRCAIACSPPAWSPAR